MKKEQRMRTIQTTEKALELLQIVASGGQNLKIQDLSQKLKISREEVLLLLVTMENRGLVTWDSYSKKYNPGGATLDMVRSINKRYGRTNSSTAAMSLR